MASKELEHAGDIVVLPVLRPDKLDGGQCRLFLDGLSSRGEFDLVLLVGRIALPRCWLRTSWLTGVLGAGVDDWSRDLIAKAGHGRRFSRFGAGDRCDIVGGALPALL